MYAVGVLEQLFHFTAEYAPCGNVGKFSDKRIAAAFDRDERSGVTLIQALLDTHWIDTHPVHRYVVHDWWDHAQTGTKNRATAEMVANSTKSATYLQSSSSDTTSGTLVAPPPALPCLALPCLAMPSSDLRKASEGVPWPVEKADDSNPHIEAKSNPKPSEPAPPPTPTVWPENADPKAKTKLPRSQFLKTKLEASNLPGAKHRGTQADTPAKTPLNRENEIVLMRESLVKYVGNVLPPPDLALIEAVLSAGNGASAVAIHSFLRTLFSSGHEPRHGPGPKSWGWFPSVVAAHFQGEK
jgi:hypothetical protein